MTPKREQQLRDIGEGLIEECTPAKGLIEALDALDAERKVSKREAKACRDWVTRYGERDLWWRVAERNRQELEGKCERLKARVEELEGKISKFIYEENPPDQNESGER